jgi:hypothetical protein
LSHREGGHVAARGMFSKEKVIEIIPRQIPTLMEVVQFIFQ